MIKIIIPGKAISKDNEKIHNKRGRPYLSSRFKQWENFVAFNAKQQMQGRMPLECDLSVQIDFVMPDKRHADLLNLPKSLCDAFNKIVWKDDRQIKQAYVGVSYNKNNPMTVVYIKNISN